MRRIRPEGGADAPAGVVEDGADDGQLVYRKLV